MPVQGPNETATALGLSRSQFYSHVRDGMPKVARGKYDLEECAMWLARHMEPDPDAAGDGISLDGARLSKLLAHAEKAERKLRSLESRVLPAELVERAHEELLRWLEAKARGFPARWAPDVLGFDNARQLHGVLRTLVADQAMRELRDAELPDLPKPKEEDDDEVRGKDAA